MRDLPFPASDPSVRVTQLDNGLRVATDSMPQVATATVGVWVDAGARLEVPRLNGTAHFLEHMLFKGTRRRTALQIAEQVEDVGGHMNAHTGREHTAYYLKVLKDDVPFAIDILADILTDSLLDPTEFDRERQVILQELGQALDTPDDIIFDHFQALAWPDQGVGRPILGTEESLKGLTAEDLRGYVGRNYRPDRMVLVASGNVDHDRVVALADAAFGGLKTMAGPDAMEPARYAGGLRAFTDELEQAHVVLGYPALTWDDPDLYALTTLTTLLGGGMSSRLFQEVRENRGLAYSIFSFTANYQDDGVLGIYAGTDPARLEELGAVLETELARLPHSLTPAEVARARMQVKSGLLMSLESSGARAEALASQLLMYGRPLPVAELVGRIDSVQSDDLVRVATRVLSGKPTLAVLSPLPADHPALVAGGSGIGRLVRTASIH